MKEIVILDNKYFFPHYINQNISDKLVEFFTKVRCACKDSKKYKNILVFTAIPLIIPAYLLLTQGHILFGLLVGMLFITSILNHTLHDSRIQTIDIIFALLTGIISLFYCIIGIFFNKSKQKWKHIYFIISLALLIAILLINICHFTKEPGTGRLTIVLEWHICMHVLTVIALISIAMGYR